MEFPRAYSEYAPWPWVRIPSPSDQQSVKSTSSTDDQSFMLFGYSIKLNKERNDEPPKQGTNDFSFQLLKTDKDTSSSSNAMLFNERKMFDFVGLMEQRSTELEKIDTMMRSKVVDETPRPMPATDLQLGIGCPWVLINSSCDRNNMPCSWPPKIKKRRLMMHPPNRNSTASVDLAIGLPTVNEENNNVVQIPSDQWEIKKKLTESDINSSSRLLIGLDMVSKHILPHIINNPEFDETRGTEVAVLDIDTGRQHNLTLRRWKSKSFVFVGGWKMNFVNKRNLKVKDEIGLRWNSVTSMFDFTVLRRNPNH